MLKTMKAVIVKKAGEVAIEEIPVPILGEYDCLARNHICGFCNGTDFQCIVGSLSHGEDEMKYPCVLGHEACCDVIQIGKKVRHIAIGDRFIRPLLTYDERIGYEITYGNMAEYNIVRDYVAMWEDGLMTNPDAPYMDNCARIPNDISFEDGAMIVTLCEALSAITHYGVSNNQEILIYGAGPIGLSACRFSVLKGAKVTIVDGIPERLHLAEQLGATRALDFHDKATEKELSEKLFDMVIDAVGSLKIILDSSWKLKNGGKVCALGVLRADDRFLDLKKLKNNTAVHVHNFQCDRFKFVDEIVSYIREGKLNPGDFWTHKLKADDIMEAMALTRSKEALKVMLEF